MPASVAPDQLAEVQPAASCVTRQLLAAAPEADAPLSALLVAARSKQVGCLGLGSSRVLSSVARQGLAVTWLLVLPGLTR